MASSSRDGSGDRQDEVPIEAGCDDDEPGAQVTIRDGSGGTLGFGSLEAGRFGVDGGEMLLLTLCAFAF
jgi:hypothetical protein